MKFVIQMKGLKEACSGCCLLLVPFALAYFVVFILQILIDDPDTLEWVGTVATPITLFSSFVCGICFFDYCLLRKRRKTKQCSDIKSVSGNVQKGDQEMQNTAPDLENIDEKCMARTPLPNALSHQASSSPSNSTNSLAINSCSSSLNLYDPPAHVGTYVTPPKDNNPSMPPPPYCHFAKVCIEDIKFKESPESVSSEEQRTECSVSRSSDKDPPCYEVAMSM
uniref:uncharacterized protein LOC120337845 n=1 Tax=Styela clava TaxID=7725 RepID=UPI00193ABB33|nr:uncharacterized protein LOC120337845 [Styela clava]